MKRKNGYGRYVLSGNDHNAYHYLMNVTKDNVTISDVELYFNIINGVESELHGIDARYNTRAARMYAFAAGVEAGIFGTVWGLSSTFPVSTFVICGMWSVYFGGKVVHYTLNEYKRVKSFLSKYGMQFHEYFKLRHDKELFEIMDSACYEDLIKREPFAEFIEDEHQNYGGYQLVTYHVSADGVTTSVDTYSSEDELIQHLQEYANIMEKSIKNRDDGNKGDNDDGHDDNDNLDANI